MELGGVESGPDGGNVAVLFGQGGSRLVCKQVRQRARFLALLAPLLHPLFGLVFSPPRTRRAACMPRGGTILVNHRERLVVQKAKVGKVRKRGHTARTRWIKMGEA